VHEASIKQRAAYLNWSPMILSPVEPHGLVLEPFSSVMSLFDSVCTLPILKENLLPMDSEIIIKQL
jgi:hypothetical protein